MTVPAPTPDAARDILHAAQQAADPAHALARHWVPPSRPARVLAVGKAAEPMLRAALARLPRLAAPPLALCPPEQTAAILALGAHAHPCDHPYPTLRNFVAALTVRTFVDEIPRDETLILLLSGGASAFLTLPVADLTLADIADVTRRLQLAGATITELNAVRKHLEKLKGGRLAVRCRAPIEAYILSDVLGDHLDVIGSGPVSPDPSTFADALRALEHRAVAHHVPRVVDFLRRGDAGQHPETPKPGAPPFMHVTTRLIAGNRNAVEAARDRAAALGFHIAGVQHALEGDAASLARHFAARARALRDANAPTPWAWIAGGEWTVTVRDALGLGGPSQELALAAALELAHESRPTLLAAYSTDGRDGPTDAAGAIISNRTAADALARAINLPDALARHDSHSALDALACLLRPGPTGTNVNHLVVILGA